MGQLETHALQKNVGVAPSSAREDDLAFYAPKSQSSQYVATGPVAGISTLI
jgi:hypothetical protein